MDGLAAYQNSGDIMSDRRIRKIAILGAESTGKTWLCERLAAHYNTAWVPEYAREYFNDSDIYNYTLEDLERIAVRQLEMEDEAEKKATEFLFCDTTLITLRIWAELEFASCPGFIRDSLASRHYDLYLVTASDIPWEKDPLRQNKHSRELLMQLNVDEVKKTGTPYAIIKGKELARFDAAVQAVRMIFGAGKENT